MRCSPGNHVGDVDENMRCTACGKTLSLFSVDVDESCTIERMYEVFQRHDPLMAMSVQFYNGSWQAGVRSQRGVGPVVKGSSPVDAIVKLIHTLEER